MKLLGLILLTVRTFTMILFLNPYCLTVFPDLVRPLQLVTWILTAIRMSSLAELGTGKVQTDKVRVR